MSTRLLDRRARPQAEAGYKRSLRLLDLTGIGIAAIIGAGIFVFLGNEAAQTGPAVMVSLAIAGAASVLAAFSYAEAASMVPGSGSAYAFSWTALGRFPAFLTGWLFVNAYAIGNAGVAAGWTTYFSGLLASMGTSLPPAIQAAIGEGGVVNLPAVGMLVLVTVMTVIGIRESAWINNLLVALKLGLVLVVIAAGMAYFDGARWMPFAPGGWPAIVQSTAVMVFAYLGFDTIAAAGAEAKNPRRDLPLGILLSVGICALLYILMAGVLTGLAVPDDLAGRPRIVAALSHVGQEWAGHVVTLGALVGLITVAYAFQLAMARILQTMAADGFAPRWFAVVSPRTGTPARAAVAVGLFTALFAAFVPLSGLIDMAVEASIAIYVLVSLGILVLRRRDPARRPSYRVPAVFHVAAIALLAAIATLGLGALIHLLFVGWMALGFMVYGFWGHRASLRQEAA